MTPGGPPVVLASGSAARWMLLEAAGLRFTVHPAAVDEAALKARHRASGASLEQTALALADAKAASVPAPGAIVIGADQMLGCDGTWFDKPADLAAARRQLLALRGRRHALATAAVCWQDGARVWSGVSSPTLRMRCFSEAFLDAYLAMEGAAVLASVGGYRLEGPGAQLFDEVSGDHATILGLPLLPLLAFFRHAGIILA